MRADDTKKRLEQTLAAMPDSHFLAGAQTLLAEMGYRSTHTLPGQSGDVADFLAQFPAANPDTQSEQAFRQTDRSRNRHATVMKNRNARICRNGKTLKRPAAVLP